VVGQQGVLNQLALRAQALAWRPGVGVEPCPYALSMVLLDQIWCAHSPSGNSGSAPEREMEIRPVVGMPVMASNSVQGPARIRFRAAVTVEPQTINCADQGVVGRRIRSRCRRGCRRGPPGSAGREPTVICPGTGRKLCWGSSALIAAFDRVAPGRMSSGAG